MYALLASRHDHVVMIFTGICCRLVRSLQSVRRAIKSTKSQALKSDGTHLSSHVVYPDVARGVDTGLSSTESRYWTRNLIDPGRAVPHCRFDNTNIV